MSPLVSVAIPAYKRAYLKECIDSILAQTFSDIELIIINDASPEDLDSIVNLYSDKRVRYYKNSDNIGAVNVVDNWNKCLGYATGKYFICMGDDDILLPYCIEEYVNLIEKHPGLGVYHAWTEIIDENSNFINITAARCEYESVYSLIWHRWNNRLQFIGDFLFDTMLLKENGGFYKLPLAWASDDISAVIAATSKGIANTQRIVFCYRINSQTISKTGSAEMKIQAIEQEREWYISFLKTVPSLDLDKKYWYCIKRMLPQFFEKKKGVTIGKDLKDRSFLRIIYWIMHRKKYKLSYKCIMYSIYIYIKR